MKPVIAITMGDPAGVGAEVIVKALARAEVQNSIRAIVVGNAEILRATAGRLGIAWAPRVMMREEREIGGWGNGEDDVVVVQAAGEVGDYGVGVISAEAGAASVEYIRLAVELVRSGQADAVCTAPISKEAIKLAGSGYPGHTEMLADLCGGGDVRMMLVGGGLHVVLQTIHVALKDVPGLISVEGVVDSLRMIQGFSCRYGVPNPRIGVCGLNPHAGEAGHFGREEIDGIAPAIAGARGEGIDACGPFPGDTIFYRTLQGDFDFVLAMYHDQALIPVKTLDFHGGVNVTVGLPIIRTSPDHGTAFNIAGQGIANESSMVSALMYAAGLAGNKKSPPN